MRFPLIPSTDWLKEQAGCPLLTQRSITYYYNERLQQASDARWRAELARAAPYVATQRKLAYNVVDDRHKQALSRPQEGGARCNQRRSACSLRSTTPIGHLTGYRPCCGSSWPFPS